MDQESGRCDRLERVQAALAEHGLSALVCSHNLNVLLLSGYWPVTGVALVIATAEPRVVLLVPEDEEELAARGWADEIRTFKPASLDSLRDCCSRLLDALAEALPPLLPEHARIGYEAGVGYLPASYVSQQTYGCMLPGVLNKAAPSATPLPADDMLRALRMRPTRWERQRIRTACDIAGEAFRHGAPMLIPGMAEENAVLPFRNALCLAGTRHAEVARADGFFYCMSGPDAARAHAAFQQSRRRPLQVGEPVLVHCNSYADGYWTDLTRTYVLGEPDERLSRMFDVVLAARTAALDAIRPGVAASEVDRAARSVLADAGYGDAFRHPTGHGVGFSAINHDEWPRIHPCSDRVLEEGMVFNVEPGIYISGYGGIRDCNMVAVTGDGHELLTPFHLRKSDWCIGAARRAGRQSG
jgi:Xaa-Pro aminopeptidase